MPASKNLVGRTYGRLYVIEKTNKRYHNGIVWKCRCECGNYVENTASALNSGHTLSCGCLRSDKNKERFSNKAGQRFGRLIVVEPTDKRSGTCVVWKCRCDCGNITYVSSGCLTSGTTKSCGCFHKEKTKEANTKNIIGERFGRLLVLKPTFERDSSGCIMWECLCDCGKPAKIASRNLQSGTTNSCGCLDHDVKVARWYIHGLSDTPEYKRAYRLKRIELKKLHDTEWSSDLTIALLNFQPYCAICGITEKEHLVKYGKHLHMDHVLPLSKGNGLKPGNAVVLCRSCNAKKHNKDINDLPLEWQASLIWNAFKFKDHWDMTHES